MTQIDDEKQTSTSKGSSNHVPLTYPTRIENIGALSCLFLSFYRGGTFPFISIGPSWPFTIGMLIFVALCVAYLLYMMTMIAYFPKLWYIALSCIIFNLVILARAICGDPGIKESIYLNHIKKNMGAKSEEAPSLLSSEAPKKDPSSRP